ncbi:MAG TPA: hypothetical protein DCE41_06635 [Cytophagales bacterium]|nr:hypothetical protein [Cytophagales bacterium]HAA21869.1 hypothetical protein [Cytophagales bacterium]HAP58253.1 hypothetical protein [Cytophagales bacterium]
MGAIVFGVIVFIAILAIGYYSDKKRREKMAAVAEQMGMHFIPKDTDKAFLGLMKTFQLGQKGNSRSATNMMKAEAGTLKTLLLDYYYQVGSGKSAQRLNQSVAIFEQDPWNWPQFILRPEHFGDRIKSAFGKDDIDFDDSPVFSKKYFLAGPDEAQLRTFFTAEMRGFFEEHQGWYVETQSNRILLCRQGKRRKPDQMVNFLQEGLLIKDKLEAALG